MIFICEIVVTLTFATELWYEASSVAELANFNSKILIPSVSIFIKTFILREACSVKTCAD